MRVLYISKVKLLAIYRHIEILATLCKTYSTQQSLGDQLTLTK